MQLRRAEPEASATPAPRMSRKMRIGFAAAIVAAGISAPVAIIETVKSPSSTQITQYLKTPASGNSTAGNTLPGGQNPTSVNQGGYPQTLSGLGQGLQGLESTIGTIKSELPSKDTLKKLEALSIQIPQAESELAQVQSGISAVRTEIPQTGSSIGTDIREGIAAFIVTMAGATTLILRSQRKTRNAIGSAKSGGLGKETKPEPSEIAS